MRKHELKTWIPYFIQLMSGDKTFELRLNDRDFREGDILVLREWSQADRQYTGRVCLRKVTSILESWEFQRILSAGYCILSIRKLTLVERLLERLERSST